MGFLRFISLYLLFGYQLLGLLTVGINTIELYSQWSL